MASPRRYSLTTANNSPAGSGALAPGEVLFDRICRENGIEHLLTKPRSPTTTGKVERFHRSLRREFLNDIEPFASIEAAQVALHAWVAEYNNDRPHQSLDTQTPAQRFARTRDHNAETPKLVAPPILRTAPQAEESPARPKTEVELVRVNELTIKLEKIVPPSGNMMIARQQIWLGPARAGQPVTFWANTSTIQVIYAETKIKAMPSRLSIDDLRTLLDGDATQVDALPITTGPIKPGQPIETDHLVNATGYIGLANRSIGIRSQFAGQRLTIRLDSTVLHLINDGQLLRSLPSPLGAADLTHIQATRPAGPTPRATDEPITVQRRVSSQGVFQINGQKIRAGQTHAGKTATIDIGNNQLTIGIDGETVATVPQTSRKETTRHKVAKPFKQRKTN